MKSKIMYGIGAGIILALLAVMAADERAVDEGSQIGAAVAAEAVDIGYPGPVDGYPMPCGEYLICEEWRATRTPGVITVEASWDKTPTSAPEFTATPTLPAPPPWSFPTETGIP